jgi:hypothetical protein
MMTIVGRDQKQIAAPVIQAIIIEQMGSFAFTYIDQFIIRVTVGRILVGTGNIVIDNQRVKLTQDRHTPNLQVNTRIIQSEEGLIIQLCTSITDQ